MINMAWEVIVTDEFKTWYLTLDEADTDAAKRAISLLEEKGPLLDHPYSSQLKESKAGLRELRIQSLGHPLRVAYAFDPKRSAILLLGADKKGIPNKRFYPAFIQRAEQIWRQYLKETKQEKGKK